MKALIVTADHRLEMREISRPEPGPYDALVRILGCGICSTTDRELIKGTQPYNREYPCILGHESIGEVIAVGDKVTKFKVGDWVTRPYALYPGQHRDGLASAWGGFAEYGLVMDGPAMGLTDDYTALRQNVVPKGLTLEQAVLAMALAETASWTWGLPPAAGRDVVVAGTGIAGLGIALWWKFAGAESVTVIGRRDERLELARAIAADYTVNSRKEDPVEVIRRRLPQGAALFAEAAGSHELVNLGLRCVGVKGTVGIYGVTPDLKYDFNVGCGSGEFKVALAPASEHVAFHWVCEVLRRGWVPVDQLLNLRLPFTEYEKAFAEVSAGRAVKAMLYWR